jgi:hypothetical protein
MLGNFCPKSTGAEDRLGRVKFIGQELEDGFRIENILENTVKFDRASEKSLDIILLYIVFIFKFEKSIIFYDPKGVRVLGC